MRHRPLQQGSVDAIDVAVEAAARRVAACVAIMTVAVGRRRLDPARGQRRRQRERHNQADRDRGRRGQAERRHEPPDNPAQETDRNEHRQQRQRRRHDREPDLARPFDRRPERRHALFLDEPVDVLQHDDRIVDDDADHQRQGEHRHLIEGEAEHGDDREGADDRGRDRDGGDERRPEVAQEDEDDDGGEDAAEHQVFLDRVERCLDELRVVANQADLDVWRQRLLNLGHPGLDRVGQRDRVDAALLADGYGQRRASVEHRDRRGDFAGVDDLANVANANRRIAARRDDEVVEGLRAAQAADRAHRQLARALLEAPARELEVLRAQRRRHVGRRQAVGVQPVRVDLDLDFAAPGAEEEHLADAVD